ncbi:Rieske 2Fe-2S domain-containing protein [Streptomyces sp. BG9H]|uniref:Cytochrome bc1 complex Rieske iron-sulfur subunit n=1 Tax=Streptomyces anatolicus TaxID=2675858 RepID=A0ABS6YK73_9ACTN|nr:Rieske (2Fe-2S) protein [Streptomyces anatolicus]MBW5421485.1 Rieske 2Fe-2S domain-containing protein [Streptomyces anatolicus]
MSGTPHARRTVLRAAALAPAVGLGLTACSSGDGGSNRSAPTAPVDLGKADDVKVGASKLYTDRNVVVSRITDDEYTAYSTICTHARCPINKLEGRKLVCQCHGSQFDATNGKVLKEPAVKPLAELPVKVENGKIIAGPEKKA